MFLEERLQKPRIVFFDAGLVLLHPDGRRLQKAVAEITGREIESSDLVDAYRVAIRCRDLAPPVVLDEFPFWSAWCDCIGLKTFHAPALAAAIQELEHDEKKLWTVLDSDAVATLTRLAAAGVRTGVISNADGELLKDLGRAGLLEYLAPCIDSVVVGVDKPDPEIFLKAARAAGATAGECWMVGDDYLCDMAPTLELGFGASILFDPLIRDTPWPDIHTAHRLTDIARWVESDRCSNRI